MKFCPDFVTNSRKEWRVSLFQLNLRKQIRNLPKILKSVKIIHYCSLLLIRFLGVTLACAGAARLACAPRAWEGSGLSCCEEASSRRAELPAAASRQLPGLHSRKAANYIVFSPTSGDFSNRSFTKILRLQRCKSIQIV